MVKVNKDTAARNNVKVLVTLNCRFCSRSSGVLPPMFNSLTEMEGVGTSGIPSRLGRYRFGVTYSIAGPLYARRNYMCVFKGRGNMRRRRGTRVSGVVERCTSYIRRCTKGEFDRAPKTNTTKNLNFTFLFKLRGIRLGSNVSVILGTVRLSGRLGGTSVMIAKRNELSKRDTVKGIPIKITGTNEGGNYGMVTLTKDIASSTITYGGRNVSTFFPVVEKTAALGRTVSVGGTRGGVGGATRRIFELVSVDSLVRWCVLMGLYIIRKPSRVWGPHVS